MSCCPVDDRLTVHFAPRVVSACLNVGSQYQVKACKVRGPENVFPPQGCFLVREQFAMVTGTLLTQRAEPLDISRELNRYHQKEHGFGKHGGNYGSCCGPALLCRASLAEK